MVVLSFSSSSLHLPSAEIIGVSLLVCEVRGPELRGVSLLVCEVRGPELGGVSLLVCEMWGPELRGADARQALSHLKHGLSPVDEFLFTVFIFPSTVQVVAMCFEMASLLE